ncbi:MAG: nucleotidyl transferase AbiEii/AbiGii toxin family protein [Ardenticatenaceae bacterium]|nr:nucleotidyl transferase AbiEii/AbiGii toxin family protein [Ardenticatenaceae bacterium]
MIAYLRELVAAAETKLLAVHAVREYLQARILQSLQRAGGMQSMAFHGGTSLRFLYNIPRYSEDLDFALERQQDLYDFRAYLQRIIQDFSAEAYAVEVKLNEKRTVNKAFIRFRGLLYDLGLSGHESEVLAVKIEVDTNPPAEAGLMTTPLHKHVHINLHHHDPATLLAGKLHAILQRNYLKGRDVFDLWWYMTQPNWPAPNLDHLNQNLRQSGWTDAPLTTTDWRSVVREKIRPLSWLLVLEDVGSFIIVPDDRFNLKNLLGLLH